MPLLMVEVGVKYTIIRVCGSGNERRHLENLGFIAGEVIDIISKFNSYVLVNVRGSRVGLGRELAKKIIVC